MEKGRALRTQSLLSEKYQLPGAAMLEPTAPEMDEQEREFETALLAAKRPRSKLILDVLDASATLNEAAAAIVDDSFTKCFQESGWEPWAWNWYLFPMHHLGTALRYLVVFPLRTLLLFLAWVAFFASFFPVHYFVTPFRPESGTYVEATLVQMLCGAFVASWTGVIKYHGPKPVKKANQVYVSNHTSMIDFIVLMQWAPFAVIMQKHKGWVGFCQDHILNCLGCVWFNRAESKDKEALKRKMRGHVTSPNAFPLLIFPEGTCVNNRYTVQFKRGAFDLGEDVVVHPVAIRYNKTFVDAFWNSKRQSFTQHLLTLMTSWAVVADVYSLEPQRRAPGESTEDFASRVQHIIAERAGLTVVPMDGYWKHYKPSKRFTEKRRIAFAGYLRERCDALGIDLGADGAADESGEPPAAQQQGGSAVAVTDKKDQ